MRAIPQASTQDYSNLVGIPYSKLNCFGLAKKFYSDILDVELKHYFDEVQFPEDRVAVQNLVYTSKGDFEKVDVPQFGDLVLMKIQGLESHIGVYVGGGKMLHSLKTAEYSVVESCHGRWKNSITGFYRLRLSNA